MGLLPLWKIGAWQHMVILCDSAARTDFTLLVLHDVLLAWHNHHPAHTK
jgi:hypothetical protein